MNGVNKVIDYFGDVISTAEAVETSPQAIRKWMKQGEVPVGRVVELEKATGIPCYELNPTHYPKDRFAEAS